MTRNGLIRQIYIFTVVAILIAAAMGAIPFMGEVALSAETQTIASPENITENKADAEIQYKREIVSNFVSQIESKVRALATNPLTLKYTAENTETNREVLTQLFYIVAAGNGNFMQVRFLGADGWEKVRVDRPDSQDVPVVISGERLQNKGNRGYFKAISRTPQGSLWHSRFDLNKERGKIEVPFNPTFRVGMPVFLDNRFKGMIIVNLRLEPFLKLLGSSTNFDVYLVDQKGFFIIHPDSEKQWSRYFPERGRLHDLLPESAADILSRSTYKNHIYSYSISQNLKNGERLKLVLIPKKSVKTKKRQTPGIELTEEEKEWLAKNKVWRIANEEDWPPFDFVEDGEASGYAIDLLQLALARLGVSIVWINGYTWDELMEQFKQGDIDVLPALFKTEERKKYIAFTHSYASNPSILIVHADSSQSDSLESLAGKKIAVISGFSISENIAERYPEIGQVKVNNVKEALLAVSRKNVAGFVGSSGSVSYILEHNYIPDVRIVGDSGLLKPGETTLYMGVLKERRIQRDILQKALDSVTEAERQKIHNKWLPQFQYQGSKRGRIALSPEEWDWLLENPNFKIGSDYSWAPFVFLDEAGSFSGLASAYADLAAEQLEISFNPVFGLTRPEVMNRIRSGGLDLVPAVVRTEELESIYDFTEPFYQSPVVIAGRKDGGIVDRLQDLSGRQVGVVDGHGSSEKLARYYPTFRLKKFKDIKSALVALESGRIEAFVGNLASIRYELNRTSNQSIKIVAPTEFVVDLRFGVRKGLPILVEALNKVITGIDGEERRRIKNTWMTPVEVQYGLDLKTILVWAVPVGGSIILIIVFVIIWNRRLGRVIDQRQELNRELKDAEQTLNIALEASNTGIWQFDLTPGEAKNSYMSDQWYRQVGYTRDDFEDGQDVLSLIIHPEDRELLNQAIDDHLNGLTDQYQCEFRMIAKDGSTHWILSKGQTVKTDGEGRPTKLTGAHVDITEHKLMVQQLRDSEDRIKTVLDSINTGIILIRRADQIITDVNPPAAEMIGAGKEEIIGKSCHQFICPQKVGECPIIDLGKTVDNTERMLLRADGDQVPILKTVVPIKLGDEDYLLESFVNLSERKKAEEELKQKMEELERFNLLTINREERMIELKEEINQLCEKLGKSPKYKIVE